MATMGRAVERAPSLLVGRCISDAGGLAKRTVKLCKKKDRLTAVPVKVRSWVGSAASGEIPRSIHIAGIRSQIPTR